MTMAKAKPPMPPPATKLPDLFAGAARRDRKYRALILPRFLATASMDAKLEGPAQNQAYEIIKKWADLEKSGELIKKKETAFDAQFLEEIFNRGLGYTFATDNPAKYNLERQFTVPNVGAADGALGVFGSALAPNPLVMIELKGAKTDLDRDKSNGRTAVQQCWDYLNAWPTCPWGIVSNFSTIRLYHRDKSPQVYQEFRLQELRKFETFQQFYCLFEAGAFLPSSTGIAPRANRLLLETETRQRTVGDELYTYYSVNRSRLIDHLRSAHLKNLDRAIHIAQKLLDRIVFIAFCEDRGLLPENCLQKGWENTPPFTRVVNPRWQNFLQLFNAIDKGHNAILVEDGYNGGLFAHDTEVDDLQLDDSWTDFFKNIGTYDFRNEVNVDVLGHIFEKSIGELELIRNAGGPLFGGSPSTAKSAMNKSAERKKFGIYYTPPAFTEFLVKQTVGALVAEQQLALRTQQSLTEAQLETEKPTPACAAYWQDCLAALRTLKICDPACGSGAFLIEAYEQLDWHYGHIVERIARHTGTSEKELMEPVPAYILNDNIYGVDLSKQSVEISQLALWLRSAIPGKKLADLSKNIVCGNSLVVDNAVHPRAMVWGETFPDVFQRRNPGFDAVIGNPPWERLKLQEREYFAHAAPDIAEAVSAATRRKLIAEMVTTRPELFDNYTNAKLTAERTLDHVRKSGEFPLTARGDINTYMLFAELARKLVAPTGRVGLLVPSGISTDHTTREFFATLMDTKALINLYDFENKAPVFPDVHRSFKFCTLVYGGSEVKTAASSFAFFLRQIEDLDEKKRHIALSAKDIALLNPNTRTCPIFRTRRDAKLTKEIYSRVPILIDQSRVEGGNPWDIRFLRMFDQTNDAELFQPPDTLKADGLKLVGHRWIDSTRTYLPLYEAKMIQAYDHRAASVVIEAGNWVRQGQSEETNLVAHQNPEFVVQPRWWVDEVAVLDVMKAKREQGCIGFKDITSPTNQRTMIASAMPWSAASNHFIMVLTSASARREMCLLGNLNALVLDYVTRQKIGGITLNFFIVEQLPIFPPDRYSEKCPWAKKLTLEKWISDRVLKLTCTANDMKPLAEAAGFDPPVHRWNPAERAELLAELDAAYFILYGIDRDDAVYILSTFQGIQDDGNASFVSGATSQSQLILEAYDKLISRDAN